jgi:hypothetical protein
MLTADQALAIQRQRRLQVRPVPGGWVAETAKGERLHRPPAATQEDAIEAAEASLVAAEGRDALRRAARLVEALARGRYFLRPRTVTGTDPDTGEPTSRRVFDAFRPDNSPVAEVRGRESFAQAVIDAEALLGP